MKIKVFEQMYVSRITEKEISKEDLIEIVGENFSEFLEYIEEDQTVEEFVEENYPNFDTDFVYLLANILEVQSEDSIYEYSDPYNIEYSIED